MKINASITVYVVDENRNPYSVGGSLNYNRSGQISGANFREIATKLDKIDTAISEVIDQEPMM